MSGLGEKVREVESIHRTSRQNSVHLQEDLILRQQAIKNPKIALNIIWDCKKREYEWLVAYLRYLSSKNSYYYIFILPKRD